jgi:hypothetical protein
MLPASVSILPSADEKVLLDLSREVSGSPDAPIDRQVSRQFEETQCPPIRRSRRHRAAPTPYPYDDRSPFVLHPLSRLLASSV